MVSKLAERALNHLEWPFHRKAGFETTMLGKPGQKAMVGQQKTMSMTGQPKHGHLELSSGTKVKQGISHTPTLVPPLKLPLRTEERAEGMRGSSVFPTAHADDTRALPHMPSFETARDYIPNTVRGALHTSRSFVSELQREALDRWLPKWSLPFATSPLDLGKAFGRQAPTILEIGLGTGDTTAELAKARPDDNFLGVEASDAGVGALLRTIEQESLTNIRIIQHDFLDVVREMIKPGSLTGIHIFFPNSWLKKRHERRALFKKPFVKLLASRIAPGGYLHCSTDWAPYAQHMLKALSAVTQLHNTAAGFSPRPASRPLSPRMSEDRGLQHGEWDMIFKKALV